MNAPNRYLALASLTLRTEVWWLNTYASPADVDRIAEAYARNTELMTAMRELAQGKKGLASDPVDLMATLRSELSDASPWLIGELRFAVGLEPHAPVKASASGYA